MFYMNTTFPTNILDAVKKDDRSEWLGFLTWMAHGQAFGDPLLIIDIVEKPHNWQSEYEQYILEEYEEDITAT